MRKIQITATALTAALMLAGAAALVAAQQPGQQPAPAPPMPYKQVTVQLPKKMMDASFDAFRKQLTTIAQKKDRPALARLVTQNFFWLPQDKDVADTKKPGIENLAKAISLDGRDAPGWEILAGFAADMTADANPERPGVFCAPGEPTFDENAAEELTKATNTDPFEWGYPASDGVPVRQGLKKDTPVLEKLGLYLVRIYPDESPAAAVQGDTLRVVTPSGKLGYVNQEAILPLGTDQLCYVKEGNAWKVAGYIGGEPPAGP